MAQKKPAAKKKPPVKKAAVKKTATTKKTSTKKLPTKGGPKKVAVVHKPKPKKAVLKKAARAKKKTPVKAAAHKKSLRPVGINKASFVEVQPKKPALRAPITARRAGLGEVITKLTNTKKKSAPVREFRPRS